MSDPDKICPKITKPKKSNQNWDSYMFNCGEGTQRLANEHKIKLSKLKHIFFTHNKWQNIGGLPGLALTIQDVGMTDITLHGPANSLENLFEQSKHFIFLTKLNIKHHPSTESFETSIFKIESIPIFPTTKTNNTCKKIKLDQSEAIVYIGTFNQTPGHVNMDRCKELKIPKGPLIGKLKKGEEVILSCGTVIKPEQVLTAGEPCFVFIVIECPTINYIASLVENSRISKYQDGTEQAELVVHFTPSEVIKDTGYQEWIGRFPSTTTHLYLNSHNPTLSNLSIHRIQTILNMLHPQIFPLLKENDSELDCKRQVETLTKYYIRPRKGLQDVSGVLDLKPELYREEVLSNSENKSLLEELQHKLEMNQKGAASGYPETVFLGTGSAIPCKVRNVSSILVTMSPGQRILLDCGEGTLGQLNRFYGPSAVKSVLSEIQVIFISHLHADHHLGLFSILLAHKDACQQLGLRFTPVLLLVPMLILPWLNGFSQYFEPIYDTYRLIFNSSLLFDKSSLASQALQMHLGLREIRTVHVLHCPNAYGIVLTSSLGHKIVYSGDTMPSEDLIKAGQHCQLLIHEATMEDELAEDALKKTHTTTSQALEVGKQMNAEFIILTHFSQRYAKIPIFNSNFHANVGVAFDNMRVWPEVYPLLSEFIPVLKAIFAEHYEQMQEKTAKKQSKAALEGLKTIQL